MVTVCLDLVELDYDTQKILIEELFKNAAHYLA